MSSLYVIASRSLILTLTVLVAALPAAAQSQGTHRVKQGSAGGSASAPEIEIALVSSALLVAAGAALILRDRKARRKADPGE